NYQATKPAVFDADITLSNGIKYQKDTLENGSVIVQFEHYPLADLVDSIDWTPFFRSWELAGRYPAILEDKVVGVEASKLFVDAKAMLKTIVDENWLEARAVLGFFPANSNGDDIKLYRDESRTESHTTLHHIRQQMDRNKQQANYCLADFIAPEGEQPDWIGSFAVSAGFGIEDRVKQFQKEHDDYNAILLEALADRFAEALAEKMHELTRKHLWGYSAEETLSNNEIIKEKYQGIRPAPGYPACPEHTEKGTIWELLDPENRIGLNITESYAMWPAAAVSGWYFAHPNSRFFGTGKVQRDQVEDYAKRKDWTIEETEKWLGPVLGYDA
ncbi:MAG: methionine synthase, partial [Cocleimonas sp.]|nr:methionine synthase [Cocleimonas sp.]